MSKNRAKKKQPSQTTRRAAQAGATIPQDHAIRDEAALTISGEGRRWSLAAGAQVVIGRSADADIRIDDPEVSRRHAQLVDALLDVCK